MNLPIIFLQLLIFIKFYIIIGSIKRILTTKSITFEALPYMGRCERPLISMMMTAACRRARRRIITCLSTIFYVKYISKVY